jgi:arginine utilization protein RocB
MKKDRMYQNLLELCGVPSVSGTPGEQEMAEKIAEMLKRIPYFQQRPEQVQTYPVPGGTYPRSYVCARMEGQIKSPKTVVLLSHFDVVGVEEYGVNRKLAFQPEKYTDYLRKHPDFCLPEEAAADLRSGDYLFGRGTMDMKFGVAAYLELLADYGSRPESFAGNLLFLSVPDEEANSAGMLAAVETLAQMKKKYGLEYVCCLVAEPYFPKYPGDETKYLYTGTVGKLLPVFYCVGKETHACEPYSGLNPNLLTARILEKIDCNPELSDSACGVFTPAPVCLKQSDTKKSYSVQTPSAAYLYFNYMTLTRSPNEVMRQMLQIAREAFEEVFSEIEKKAEDRGRITGEPVRLPARKPITLTFAELYQMCRQAHGAEFESHMQEFLSHLNSDGGKADLRERSVQIVQEVHKFCPCCEPMIVVFFAPPFYPHSQEPCAASRAVQTCRYLIDRARQEFHEEWQEEPYFPGLSDMSYLGLPEGTDIEGLKKNFPAWGCGYEIPLDTIAQLNIPFLNIGPHGKDAHRTTERLCLSDSFEKTVPLIYSAVEYLLNGN